MVEDMSFPLKYRYKCHQCESENQNHHNESDHATEIGGPRILLLIIKGCPILAKGDILQPREPAGATVTLLNFCVSGREVVDS
jgi:hypothetical protein